MRPSLLFVAIVGTTVLLASAVGAQPAWVPADGSPPVTAPTLPALNWEPVGDRPTATPALAFDSEGTLYAGHNRLWQLVAGSTVWEQLQLSLTVDDLLALGPDTLLLAGQGVRRSTDGGLTWIQNYARGGDVVYEVRPDMILAGTPFDSTGAARSTDRGASWTPVTIVGASHFSHGARAFAAFPPDHPQSPGRIVSGMFAGLSYSDDGGATWELSNVWQDNRYAAEDLVVAPDGAALAVVADGANAGWQVYRSQDGASWLRLGALFDPTGEGIPGTPRFVAPTNRRLGPGQAVVVVTGRGFVWRSEDDGVSWAFHEGRVPLTPGGETYLREPAAINSDGRVYVGVARAGGDDVGAWVYRTTGIVVDQEATSGERSSHSLDITPNPASSGFTIGVTLASASVVRGAVRDALGREVALLFDGARAAGRHEFAVAGGMLRAGVYLVHIEIPAGIAIGRVTIRP